MNILIKNIPDTYNYGSMMMAENIITYLNKRLNKNINYYTEAFTPSDIERLINATGYNEIYKDDIFSYNLITKKIKYVRYIERSIRKKLKMKKACNFYDVIIVLGGDDFAETYYKIPKDNIEIKRLFNELQYFNKNTKLFMIGQTIGPYTGERINMAKKGFEDIKIYSRDDLTAKYMKETFDLDINISRDLAFLDLHLQNEYVNDKVNILKKHNLKEDEYIVIVGTHLLNKYSKEEKDVIKSFYHLIKELKKKYKDKKIVWLSHVLTPNRSNDNTLYNLINETYDNYLKKECISIIEPILPVEARIILGNGIFTITCRMHAAVSTLQMKRPAISLSYSNKYRGVIAEGLNLEDLVIDAKNDLLWDKKIIKLILEKCDYVLKNYDVIVDRIDTNVIKSQKKIKETLEEIIESLD